MTKTDSFKQVSISSVESLRRWLNKHHKQNESVWLVTFRKHVGKKYVSTSEVLDELLCFGWIDGIRRKLDEDRTMQLISPRKIQHWAKSYKDRVERLTQAGRMHESGLATVAESKRSGLWNFMDDVDDLIIPKDLREALSDLQHASTNFESCSDSYKRNVLRWIKLAKTKPTRQKRIQKIVDFAASNNRIPQM